METLVCYWICCFSPAVEESEFAPKPCGVVLCQIVVRLEAEL